MKADTNLLLRHILSTISYRFTKAIHAANEKYWEAVFPEGVRKPLEIIFHISNVLSYVPAVVSKTTPEIVEMQSREKEIERFYKLIEECDKILEKNEVEYGLATILIQGPLSDILTHIGQLSIMRRLTGDPVKGENFMKATIEIGKVKRENHLFRA